jgi:hypothetical protein
MSSNVLCENDWNPKNLEIQRISLKTRPKFLLKKKPINKFINSRQKFPLELQERDNIGKYSLTIRV